MVQLHMSPFLMLQKHLIICSLGTAMVNHLIYTDRVEKNHDFYNKIGFFLFKSDLFYFFDLLIFF